MLKRVLSSLIIASVMFSFKTIGGCDGKHSDKLKKKHGPDNNSFKVLAIGNSFSEDSVAYLYQIADALGYEEIVIGSLYIGGCSLKMHYDYFTSDSPSYSYFKNTEGKFIEISQSSTFFEGLIDEEWDYITIQQVSGLSGIPDSYYPYLDELITYINANKTNQEAQLVWHMTWAYQANSTHPDFVRYDNNQITMYNEIIAVQKNIIKNKNISFIIPSGTAIQNARTSWVGDTLTRDGYHLSIPLGRYISAMTWFCAITEESIDELTTDLFEKEYMDIAKEAVNAAILQPFKVTKSKIKEKPESFGLGAYNLDEYELLDWEPKPYSFYNSSSNSKVNTNKTSEFNARFLASKIFSKADLPIGTLIVVEEGYQYRPEGWITLNKTNADRPAQTDLYVFKVTDSWWGDFQYRAFNFSSKVDNTDISHDYESYAENLKIYVPKN